MRQSKPGLGEITSVIIVIAVFAIATPILVYNYYERADISSGIVRERLDQQRLRAEEQMAISNTECNSAGLVAFIHNYGKTTFEAADIERYKINADGSLAPINSPDLRILHLDGTEDPPIGSGDTVILRATVASINCSTDRILLLSEAGNRMVIEP